MIPRQSTWTRCGSPRKAAVSSSEEADRDADSSASDPLPSNAYATEAALVVLLGVSVASQHLILPLAIAVSILLAVVIASYRQVIFAYSKGGGGYTAARENLGEVAGSSAAQP